MAKAGFYAVARGRKPGVYSTWADCEDQVKGYARAKFKKFNTFRQAEAFIAELNLERKPNDDEEAANVYAEAAEAFVPQLVASTSTSNIPTVKPVAPIHQEKPVKEGWDVVYCDGACKGNGKGEDTAVAGVGVWWEDDDPRNIAERCPGDQTNNRAELIAIARVLEELPASITKLVIKTDSNYSIGCLVKWHQKWASNNWMKADKKPVQNVWLIRYILALLQLKQLQGVKIRFEYVKGHAGIRGNEGADAQANLGAYQPQEAERDWEGLFEAKMTEIVALQKAPAAVDRDKGLQVDVGDFGEEAFADDAFLGDEGFPNDDELDAAMDYFERRASSSLTPS